MLATPLLCMTMAIYFEARSEDLIGQNLVANVIMNRVKSNKYPNDVCGVVEQNWQFSFYNGKSDSNPLKVNPNNKHWRLAEELATMMISGKIDYGVGCYYHTTKVSPKWNRKMKVAMIHDSHIFYKDC